MKSSNFDYQTCFVLNSMKDCQLIVQFTCLIAPHCAFNTSVKCIISLSGPTYPTNMTKTVYYPYVLICQHISHNICDCPFKMSTQIKIFWFNTFPNECPLPDGMKITIGSGVCHLDFEIATIFDRLLPRINVKVV